MKTTHKTVRFPSLMLAALLGGACGEETSPPMSEDILDGDQAFVAVPRVSGSDVVEARAALTNGNSNGGGAMGSLGIQQGDNNFYLAIRKDVLDQRWFLSALLKQAAERSFSYAIPYNTLGTRVVSFKRQNGKLFVFDASDQRMGSEIVDPPNLLEAYPIVDLPEFNRLRGSDRYVLIDPSAGLNRFGITTDLYEDWGFRDLTVKGDLPIRVGLAFMQNFRALSDGISFEEVFTGDFAVGTDVHTVWGTLGLSLRRYSVGEGFSPTSDLGIPHYFATGFRLVPDSGGYVDRSYVKWNVRRGMKPVKILISAGAARAQADLPDVDVLGAFERGIESWNDVFGFPVFEAVFVNDDAIRDDDASFILVDYPGIGSEYAFADFRANPINGEIRGLSVFFSGMFFQDPGFTDDASAGEASRAKSAFLPTWGAMADHRPACAYPARLAPNPSPAAAAPSAGAPVDANQKRSLFIQAVVAHEIGHGLGLRHNFAGSLQPPSSSIMDYLSPEIRTVTAEPGSYDRDAVRYLYGMTTELPAQPFCTDDHVGLTPLCERHDQGANPLYDYAAPYYLFYEGLLLDGSIYPQAVVDWGIDYYVNSVLMFARDAGTIDPVQHTDAIWLAFDRTAVPMSAADAGSAAVVSRANRLAEIVLRRIVLDDPSLRGAMTADVSDPAAIALVASQAGQILRNEDGVRTLQLRRTAVDVLERLQTDVAFLELVASRAAIQAALANGQVPPMDAPFVEDLLTRVSVALTPYFD